MKEKDIKTKPQGVPKVKSAPKTNPYIKNAASDIKSAAKDVLVRDVIKNKADEAKQNGQSDRAEVQATENVENAAYTTADAAYHKGKTFVQNKIKQHSADKKLQEVNAPKTAESADHTMAAHTANAPKTPERPIDANAKNITQNHALSQNQAQVKTKENDIKSQPDAKVSENKTGIKVKTKESYIQSHSSDTAVRDGIKQKFQTPQMPKTKDEVIHTPDLPKVKTTKQARQEYVAGKLKTKAEYEKIQAEQATDAKSNASHHAEHPIANTTEPKTKPENIPKDHPLSASQQPSVVKTKENYMNALRAERAEPVKAYGRTTAVPKGKTQTVSRSTANTSKAVKTKQSVSKANKAVKSGNIYQSANAAKKTAYKAKKAKKAVKTQKEVTKKTAREATKRAKQAAQKTAQAAKAATKAAVRIAVKVAQLVAAAVTKLVSALVAMGGWAVLLVVLIIVIIVAAIAASPFGIFISDEAADSGSIPVSSIVAECNMELSAKLDEIENSAAADKSEIVGEQANWDLVLAVFATKVAGVEDDTVEDVVVITEEKKQKLKDVFWDMHEITSRTETVTSGETPEKVVYITINTKTKDDMIAQYGFTRKQREALDTLLEQDEMLISATHSLAISDGTAQDILKNLPDSLSPERKKVIKAACSLVGKVNYFWGGKSSAIGWDSEWGKLKTVSAEGSKTTGTKRPFGLDCSGFITWSFINSGFNASQIGHGTKGQIAKCTRIPWSQAQPGDLAFLSDLSHVGIVAGKDESGNILVIHCASGANNVVITTNSIFGFAARPGCY